MLFESLGGNNFVVVWMMVDVFFVIFESGEVVVDELSDLVML